MENEDLVFIVLMRTDIPSLKTTGKGAAQATHAQRQATVKIERECLYGGRLKEMYQAWDEQSGENFGTTLVLGAEHEEIMRIVDLVKKVSIQRSVHKNKEPIPSGVILDKTFPVTDGPICATTPVESCGWLFGYREVLDRYVRHLELF